MKILIVLPPNLPSGGNWTYSGRLQHGLEPYGIEITRKALDEVSDSDIEAHDIIHSYNAYATGRHLAPIAKRLCKPLVLTMTGTDVNEHLKNEETRPSMVEAVDYATRIIFLTEKARERLAEVYPNASRKSQTINLSIDLPPGPGKTRRDFDYADDEFIFLLVAGIRPVKQPLLAYEPLARVHERYPQVRFALAGSRLDEQLFAEVEATFRDSPFARYLGAIPYEEIADLYRIADVVMNTSSSEGLSHALLEGMSLGKPVLATNVPGNDDLIQDGENGFLFATAEEFVEKASLLIEDDSVRHHLSKGALRTIEERFSFAREMNAFRNMYREVLNHDPCTLTFK
jgi:glycosyltransferase involved in cell wall biosynthesis